VEVEVEVEVEEGSLVEVSVGTDEVMKGQKSQWLISILRWSPIFHLVRPPLKI